MRAKLGLAPLAEDLSRDARLEQDNKDLALIGAFTGLLEQNALDYTQSLRRFGELDPKAENSSLRDDFINRQGWDDWLPEYRRRIDTRQGLEQWQAERRAHNPKYILRNYLAQEAIIAIEEEGNSQPLEQLYQLLRRPFDEQPEMQEFAKRPPDWGQGLIMSCSS